LHATETNHAEEVLDVVLPADHQPTKMMEPSEESFHSPTSAIAAQLTTILRRRPAFSAMGCDHLDAVTLGQVPIQTVTVVSRNPIKHDNTTAVVIIFTSKLQTL
jgi:hypothetical protein